MKTEQKTPMNLTCHDEPADDNRRAPWHAPTVRTIKTVVGTESKNFATGEHTSVGRDYGPS